MSKKGGKLRALGITIKRAELDEWGQQSKKE